VAHRPDERGRVLQASGRGPQRRAITRYRNPSYPQALALFKPLGLTGNGFTIPRNWGRAQINALQTGYETGRENINNTITSIRVTQVTNY
jgi:hypothetical protein